MLERASGVVRGINENALDLAGELGLYSPQRKQVVSKNEPVIEDVIVRDSMCAVMRLVDVFEKNPGLKLWPVLLPNPIKLEPLLSCHDFAH